MLGQKSYLVGLSVNTIHKDKLDIALEKAGVLDIWQKHKQQVNNGEYIIVGMYTNTLSKDKASQFKGMVYRLRDAERINPVMLRGPKRSNLLTEINPNYSNAGYPLTLLNKKDFLCVMCMLDVEKVGDIMSNTNNRKPLNQFESLLSK